MYIQEKNYQKNKPASRHANLVSYVHANQLRVTHTYYHTYTLIHIFLFMPIYFYPFRVKASGKVQFCVFLMIFGSCVAAT